MKAILGGVAVLSVVASAACGSSSSGSSATSATTTTSGTTTAVPAWFTATIADCKKECENAQAATCTLKPLHGLAECQAACDTAYPGADDPMNACQDKYVAYSHCLATAKQDCCADPGSSDPGQTRPCAQGCDSAFADYNDCFMGALDAGTHK
jgi:hypothetical protein